ncbi:ABC transporter ATP-binding protein [Clostridium guangxiense]|uniref:ABC transporter ATP-binding protein n=1 Tax=Clostridium guangxiense TaxID=1662055 RepID=UPI001E3FB667|nr:ABC transporter ATP-binding protein [Clostridium guangxiense]MCD2348157.1 ABC transporter ATP-binding protein/permease [Clostridium guangxiense]
MKENIIIDFFKKNKLRYSIGLIFMIASSYIQTLFPKILGDTIDILKNRNFKNSMVNFNITYMVLIAFSTFVCTFIWRNMVMGGGRKLENNIREKLFDHFQKLSPEFYNNEKTGNLIAYAINDISAVRMTFGPATAMSINGLVICISSIYSMITSISFKLTIMCLAPIPFIIIMMLKIGKMVQHRFRKVQENFANISDRVQENINGIRVIKAYVQEEKEVKNFEELNDKMMDSNLKLVRISSSLSPIIELCFSISFVFNLIIGGNMVLKGQASLGDFVAFNTYISMIMAPVISIGRVIIVFQRGMASLKRLNKIFKVEPAVTNGKAMIEKDIEGNIELKNLTFSYPGSDKKVLNNISLIIKKGSTIGIIGKTGSGKTTLTNLLLKLYNVENGTILFDGTDINDYTLNSIRSSIGYVPQDNFLFSASIKENISFFNDIYKDEEIENSAKAACIYKSIMDFPNEFNTVLGERGVNISGGQKQRVSIARAIIKNPSILILDDSLSAVDAVTETKILSNLKDIRKDKTAIIITHRLSAVKDADEIIVLDEGHIAENGTHDELLSKGGIYYGIYKEQFKAEKSKPETY